MIRALWARPEADDTGPSDDDLRRTFLGDVEADRRDAAGSGEACPTSLDQVGAPIAHLSARSESATVPPTRPTQAPHDWGNQNMIPPGYSE